MSDKSDGIPRFRLETTYPDDAGRLIRLQAAYDLASAKAVVKFKDEPNEDVRRALALVECEDEWLAFSEAKAIDTEHACVMNCLHIDAMAKYHDWNSKSWREREE